MRLSANHASPYYRADLVRRAMVFVDGMAAPPTIEASESEGWADVVVYDDAGHIVVASDGDSVAIERRYGRVQIVLSADR